MVFSTGTGFSLQVKDNIGRPLAWEGSFVPVTLKSSRSHQFVSATKVREIRGSLFAS